MNSISLALAKRKLSELIEEVEQGEGFVITRDGSPVAKLVPHNAEKGADALELRDGAATGNFETRNIKNKMDDPEWAAAYRRMVARMKKGAHLGGLKINREELYDRGLKTNRDKAG